MNDKEQHKKVIEKHKALKLVKGMAVVGILGLSIIAGTAYYNKDTFVGSSAYSILASYQVIYEKLDAKKQAELIRSMNYLIAKEFYETKNNNIYDMFFPAIYEKEYDSSLVKLFKGKTYQEIIDEAKKTAFNDGVNSLDQTDGAKFIYDYYSLLLKDNKISPNISNDDMKLLYTMVDSKLSLSNVKDFKGILSREDIHKIESSIFNNYLKSHNYKVLSDLPDKINSQVNEDYNESVELVKKYFYTPFDKQKKIERVEKKLAYMKDALSKDSYKNKIDDNCSVKGLEYKDASIVDTTINGKTFKTFDFKTTNYNYDMTLLNASVILRDKSNNYYILPIRSWTNNPVPHGSEQHYKVVINTNRIDINKIDELSVEKFAFTSCFNPDNPFYTKDSLKNEIEITKEKLIELKK